MNLVASLPSASHRIAPIAAFVAVVLHAAAAWLAWITPGVPVVSPPTPLEVRFLQAPATESAASPRRPVEIPPPVRPLAVEPGPAVVPPSRTPAVESPAPAPEAPAAVAAPAAPAEASLPAAAPVQPAAALPADPATTGGPAVAPAVSAPRFDAAYLSNPPPIYPVISRRMGEEGRVLLRVFVEADGRPSRVEVRESSGFRRLDDAAQAAVQRWRFVPARRGESDLAAWVLVPINFTLKSS